MLYLWFCGHNNWIGIHWNFVWGLPAKGWFKSLSKMTLPLVAFVTFRTLWPIFAQNVQKFVCSIFKHYSLWSVVHTGVRGQDLHLETLLINHQNCFLYHYGWTFCSLQRLKIMLRVQTQSSIPIFYNCVRLTKAVIQQTVQYLSSAEDDWQIDWVHLCQACAVCLEQGRICPKERKRQISEINRKKLNNSKCTFLIWIWSAK